MIIYEDGSFITSATHPNVDSTGGQAKYVIDDASELAQKVMNYFPNYKIIADEDGNVTDIVKTELSEEQLTGVRAQKINETKVRLAEWLSNNPYQFTDGKFYSVTEEKQALLNSNLASYERATKAGLEYPLKWNSTGEECSEWTYENLLTLSLSIAAYVAPKVSIQQSTEVAIKNAKTKDEIDAIEINYSAE